MSIANEYIHEILRIDIQHIRLKIIGLIVARLIGIK